ncbi:MAG: hypothetical protein EZS28_026706, partial [Streblomastix strix]
MVNQRWEVNRVVDSVIRTIRNAFEKDPQQMANNKQLYEVVDDYINGSDFIGRRDPNYVQGRRANSTGNYHLNLKGQKDRNQSRLKNGSDQKDMNKQLSKERRAQTQLDDTYQNYNGPYVSRKEKELEKKKEEQQLRDKQTEREQQQQYEDEMQQQENELKKKKKKKKKKIQKKDESGNEQVIKDQQNKEDKKKKKKRKLIKYEDENEGNKVNEKEKQQEKPEEQEQDDNYQIEDKDKKDRQLQERNQDESKIDNYESEFTEGEDEKSNQSSNGSEDDQNQELKEVKSIPQIAEPQGAIEEEDSLGGFEQADYIKGSIDVVVIGVRDLNIGGIEGSSVYVK